MQGRMSGVLRLAVVLCCATVSVLTAADEKRPVKVFILAGDENCLEQGVDSGRTDGMDAIFFPNENPVKDELGKHVNCAVYKGAYEPGADYGKLVPEVTALVGIGESMGRALLEMHKESPKE